MLKKGIYLFVISIICLASIELILNLLGFKKGEFRRVGGFNTVDSLVVYRNFETDESGIYKFSSWASDSLPKFMKSGLKKDSIDAYLYPIDKLDYLHQSYIRIIDTGAFNSLMWRIKRMYIKDEPNAALCTFYSKAVRSHNPNSDVWQSVISDYVQHPLNDDGFRSIAFKNHLTNKKKILLIGDSFVYGMSAMPFYNSFYDILLSEGFMVYGAGIPGTDPAQYAAIAEKYVPIIKPDVVIVCFYPGNDMMNFARVPAQNQPYEHITNAGFFNSNINGKYYSAKEAYSYYANLVQIPQATFLDKLLASTAIGSRIWGFLFNIGLKNHPVMDITSNSYKPLETQISNTRPYIESWRKTCEQNHIPCLDVVIPDYNSIGESDIIAADTTTLNKLFGAHYFFADSFSKATHFPKDDYHFNNKGQLKFASFLKGLLLTKGKIDSLEVN